MKRFVFFLIASLLFASGVYAQRTIVVTNTTGNDRKAEIVEVKICKLKSDFNKKSFILKNEKGQETGYQLVYDGKKNPSSLIFQADVKANSTSTYTLTEGKPANVKSKTFARFVPERKDDFAWENDMAAYRMYGPALANENPSNGVDLWLKSTTDLVVDQRYNDDIHNEISYHIDHGKGLDCYKVAHTLGCGGITPYADDSLWIGNHYDHYKVIEVGPLRSVFSLTYDSVKVGDKYYKEVLTITCDAGSILNKGVVTYTGPAQQMELASGIYLHEAPGNLKVDVANGTQAYAEPAVSDFNVPAGRDYIGVVVSEKVNNSKRDGDHSLLLSPYKVGQKFTYYFGGGWNKWIYYTDNDWFKAIENFKTFVQHPLLVKVK